ncbi:restriction endonuclease [Streptomyces hypolithicus]
MTMPVRRRGLASRRPSFSLRQTVLCFGLLALLLGGAGLTLKLAARAAGEHPGAAAMTAAALVALTALLWNVRRRRAAGRIADAVVDATYRIAEPQDAPEAVLEPEAHAQTFGSADYAAMDPDSFEQAVAALCERDGCVDIEVVGGAGDLGADVVATTPDGRRIVIQCKRYGPLNKVGSQDVQRFGGTCFAVHEAHIAAVVTTGEFTQPAADYAEQCGILCVDHQGLVAWTDGTGAAPWEAAQPSPA